MPIAMVRIDDRLIHGQIAIGWTKVLRTTVIVVADDEVAEDTMQKSILKTATPVGVRSTFRSVADSAELLLGPKIANEKTLVIVKGPRAVLGLIDKGVQIPKVTIGNLRDDGNRRKISKEIFVSDDEWEAFKELDRRGVELIAQWLPGGDSKNINDVIKKEST